MKCMANSIFTGKNVFNSVWRKQCISVEWMFTFHREAVLRFWCLDIRQPNIYHLYAMHRHRLVDLWKKEKREREREKNCGMHFHDICAFTHRSIALVWIGCSLRANVPPMAVAKLHYPMIQRWSYENRYFVLKYQRLAMVECQSWSG